MPFTFKPLAIPEILLIKPQVFGDARGFFLETYKHSEFSGVGVAENFVQCNYSKSEQGVLRGLHYQNPPMAQGKLIMVIQGAIYDVAVDIRQNSPTYGQWIGEEISSDNHHLIYVPPGFAHGFCVLSASADVLYHVTAEYSPEHDRGILWNDPQIGIDWPLAAPQLSEKDAAQPLLRDANSLFE